MNKKQVEEVKEYIGLLAKYHEAAGEEYEKKGESFKFMVDHARGCYRGLHAALEVIEKMQKEGKLV